LKNSRNSFFFFKRRAKCTKRGPMPPLLRKKGAPANFLRGRQIFDTENTDRVFLRYGIGNTGEIPTEYRPKIPNWYTTLDIWIPIYKTIPAICNTPRQTQCVRNSIFPHFIMVIMLHCGPSCGLWFAVVCWCAK